MWWSLDHNSGDIWAQAVQSLPERAFKFALNVAHSTLPHNAILHIWHKKTTNQCPLRKEDMQNLIHVLDMFRDARDLGRFNNRHEEVLEKIHSAVKKNLPQSARVTADIDGYYEFPSHIVTTDLRLDIVWWDDSNKTIYLLELTVCFNALFSEAASRIKEKYKDLMQNLHSSAYKPTFLTIEVGSRGLPNTKGCLELKELLQLSRKCTKTLMVLRLLVAQSWVPWTSGRAEIEKLKYNYLIHFCGFYLCVHAYV